MVLGDGKGTAISMSKTQFLILIPAVIAAIVVLPGGYILQYQPLNLLTQTVRAGGTINYTWAMTQYLPILMTLAFASSMLQVAVVSREVWKEDDGWAAELEELDVTPATPIRTSSRFSRASPSPAQGNSASKRSFLRMHTHHLRETVRLAREKKKQHEAAKVDQAKLMLARLSTAEVVQWGAVVVYILGVILSGIVLTPGYELWTAKGYSYLIGMGILFLFGLAAVGATVSNARVTLIVRAEKSAPSNVAGILKRVCFVLLVQHLCFFAVASSATGLSAAIQPVAFTSSMDEASKTAPCNLITASYVTAHCSTELNLVLFGGVGELMTCNDGGYNGTLYASTLSACDAAVAATKIRMQGFSALAINANALAYLMLLESTQGMDQLTLDKFVAGSAGQRTMMVGVFLVVALGILPFFFFAMFAAPSFPFQSNLVSGLVSGFFLNLSCWMGIGVLLNVEFLSSFMRYKTSFDVFLSYRVSADVRLAQLLYNALRTQHGLRVYWDKECLEDGKPWEEGFVNGLFKANVYALLISKKGMGDIPKLKKDSPVDNLFLEIRLAREMLHLRGENAFSVQPLLIGEYNRVPDNATVAELKEGEREGFTRFKEFSEFSMPEGVEDVAVDSVETLLSEVMVKLGMGSSPRTPGGVFSNLRWLLKIQGIFAEPGTSVGNAMHDVAHRVTKVARRVTEAPYKPTSQVLQELYGAVFKRSGRAKLSPRTATLPVQPQDAAMGRDVGSEPLPPPGLAGVLLEDPEYKA